MAQRSCLQLHVLYRDLVSDGVEEGKYTANFPYPYMNGVLHLGHGFSLSKVRASTCHAAERNLLETDLYLLAFSSAESNNFSVSR